MHVTHTPRAPTEKMLTLYAAHADLSYFPRRPGRSVQCHPSPQAEIPWGQAHFSTQPVWPCQDHGKCQDNV